MALSPEDIDALAKRLGEEIAQPIDARIEARIDAKQREKWERMVGIDCADPEQRAELRKDHEFLRDARLRAQSDQGRQREHALKNLTRLYASIESAVATYLARALFLGLLGLIALGAWSSETIKNAARDFAHAITR